MYAAVQELKEAGHEDAPHTGISHRERVRAKEEGRSDLVWTEGRPLADRMAPQQVDLQRSHIRVGDRDVRKLPEPGLDAIRQAAFRDDLLEGPATRVDSLCGGRGEAHGFPPARHRDNIIEVEGPSVDRTHGGPRRHPASSINVFAPAPKT
jgi:hypothetical protein